MKEMQQRFKDLSSVPKVALNAEPSLRSTAIQRCDAGKFIPL